MSHTASHTRFEKCAPRIVWMILLLYPLIGMGVDLLTPSLPAITKALHTSDVFSKNLVSIYLLGYAVENAVVGFLSDALGRRKLLLGGLFGFFIASLLPTQFPNESVLLAARFFQGLTLSAFGVNGRAIFSDVLPTEKLMHTMTWMVTMWGLGPVVGPVIGGYLQFYFGWQAGFYFFAAIGLIGFVSLLCVLPETHLHREPLNLKKIKQNFAQMMRDRQFMGFVFLMGLVYSWLLIFHVSGSFFIQVILEHSPVYFGHLALGVGCGFLAGTFVARFLMKSFAPAQIIAFALPLCFGLMGVLLIASFYLDKNMYLLMSASGIMFLGCGILFPAAAGSAAQFFRHIAGSAAAVMQSVNVLIASLTTAIASMFWVSHMSSLVGIYFLLTVLSLICYIGWIRTRG